MAPSVFLLYILFTIGCLSKYSIGVSHLELGLNFIDEPKDVTGVKGKRLSLPCQPKGIRHKESFHIVWYHDNKQMDLKNDKRRTIFQNGTLHFSKLIHKGNGHSDQGEYRCVAVRENGSLSSKPGYLRITGWPENFSLHPLTQKVKAGSNVRLMCEINYSPDIEIDWEKDSKTIKQNTWKYATISGSDIPGSILYIFNVVPDDSGSYRCTARNILSNRQRHSSSGVLTVLPHEPETDFNFITFLSAQQTFPSYSTNMRQIKEGDNITLDCVVNNYSVPTLGWTFLEYGQNTSRNILNFTNEGYNIINLKNVTRHQAGWYICSAINLLNKSSKKLKTHLKVLVAPEIQEKSDGIIFRTSKTVRFRCVAFGNPVPEMYWLKDGSLFNITGRIKHRTSVNDSLQLRFSELIVSSTVASDAGIYQCMAKNLVGWSWAASRLLLNASKPAPGAPERVSCESLSSTQIKLTWDVSNTSSDIKAFSVHYHLTDYGEEMQKVMPSNSRSIQIDKLLPFSNYTFYIRLYMDSASEFSEKAICQTGEEVPIDGPEKKWHIVGPHSVHVSWLPLTKEKARGVVNRYKIQWRYTKSPSSRVVEVNGNVSTYTITGLIPGKKYDLRVLAATNKGWPDFDLPWETFEIPLNFNSNIPSPPEIKLRAINSSGIEVRWNLPAKETKLIGYKIFYRKQNGSQIGPITVPAGTNKYIVAGLEPETWYEIMVLGFTQEDEGEIGVSFMHTLSNTGSSSKIYSDFPSIPEPPVSLEADPVSSMAINLTWSSTQASSGLSNIKHYTVCFNPVQTSRIKNPAINCVKSLENKISIVGLRPYTLYEFKVRSHDVNDKHSIFSQTMECHTLEDVPSQVLDINWKAINKTTIQVSWKEPQYVNGILKSYSLFYSEDNNLPLNLWNTKSVSAETCDTLLTDLISNVKYYLVIRASTNAGFGSYASPKQMLIPSKTAAKVKQSDHYIGIIVGLGIGVLCIIICTTCILCRRRCLKRQISQDFEGTTSRHTNGNVCQRDREHVVESRETEYFTFLSSQRQPNPVEIAIRHLDTKENYSNGLVTGSIRMSLLTDNPISNESMRKKNIYITENPRYDEKNLNSPLLNSKTYCVSPHRICSNSKLNGDCCNESKTPLLMAKAKSLEAEVSYSSNNNISESEICNKVQSASHGFSRTKSSYKSKDDLTNFVSNNSIRVPRVEKSCSQETNEDESWVNVSNILKNPDFRFSNIKSLDDDRVKKHCCYMQPNYQLYYENNGLIKYNIDYCLYKNSKSPLHFITKEIIQES